MALPSGIFNTDYREDTAIVRTTTQWVLLFAFLALLVIVPLFVSDQYLSIAINIGVSIIAALGLSLMLGYCGQVSAAQSAFMGVGAFASGILVTKLGFPLWLSLPAAAVIAGLAGLVFGIPSLRVEGLYLALTTLAAQFVLAWIILHWNGLTNGVNGINLGTAKLGPLTLDSDRSYYYLVLVAAFLLTIVALNIVRSRLGRAFIAIRDNDKAAAAIGINVFPYKLLAFFIGCAYAGIAGALQAHYAGTATMERYSLWESIVYVGIVVIGGLGSISGTIFGVIFFRLLQELSYNLSTWLGEAFPSIAGSVGVALPLVVAGLVITVFLIVEPRGLAHRWQRFKTWYRLWPFAYD